jgi:hypothetical protein
MSSRAETEVVGYRTVLEKALESDDAQEEIKDVLKALKAFPITIDILRRTKIGLTIQELKKKHAGDNIGAESKGLLSKWKKDCSAGEGEKPKAAQAEPSKAVKAEVKAEVEGEVKESKVAESVQLEKAQASKSEEFDDNDNDVQDSRVALLSPLRRDVSLVVW